jgi:hypothetical protein
VLENLFYDGFGLDKGDDSHRPMALGTRQRIDFIDSLYPPCPVLEVPSGWFLGLQDARYQFVLVCLFALTPTDIAVVAIVTNHLFALIGNMGTHGSEPLRRIKGLFVFSILRPVENLAFIGKVGHPLAQTDH